MAYASKPCNIKHLAKLSTHTVKLKHPHPAMTKSVKQVENPALLRLVRSICAPCISATKHCMVIHECVYLMGYPSISNVNIDMRCLESSADGHKIM